MSGAREASSAGKAGGGGVRPEQRAHPRHLAELPVLVHDVGNRVRGAIRFDTRDLSLGGAFLRSDLLFEVGEELAVEFQLPDGPLVRARGHVAHVVRAPIEACGMGIAFGALADGDRDAVRAFLSRP